MAATLGSARDASASTLSPLRSTRQSPNTVVERVIGTLRRECLDQALARAQGLQPTREALATAAVMAVTCDDALLAVRAGRQTLPAPHNVANSARQTPCRLQT